MRGAIIVVAALFGCMGALRTAHPESPAERDNAEIRSYLPTDARLHAYFAATRALRSAVARDPALSSDCGAMSQAQEDGRLATLYRSLAAHPRCYAFFRKNGLTERETGIWMTLVFWMSQYAEQPEQVAQLAVLSAPQAKFAQEHRAQFEKFMRQFSAGADPSRFE